MTCKYAIESMNFIADHIKKVASNLDRDSVKKFVDGITEANRIFLIGAGRSGLVAKAFAMRLMHMGFTVYVVGDATTPAVKKNDLLIAVSGSGETSSVSGPASIAKNLGTKLATITSNKNSTLAKISDYVVIIPGRTKEDIIYDDYSVRSIKGYPQLAPLGTIFEITSLVFLDAIVSELMKIIGAEESDLKMRHNPLE